MPIPIAVDLFAGCGGLSEGLARAGFNVRAAVEIDPHAANTYRENHRKTYLFEDDVRNVTAEQIMQRCKRPIALLAGCAPCQGFCSLTVKNRKVDPRNTLVLKMAELIGNIRPQAVMMENVPGLETRGKKIFKNFLDQLRDLGYHIVLQDGRPAWRIVQMADYGVPQLRRRLVLLAGLGFDISFPEPTHARVPPKGSGRKKWLTLRHVIGNEKRPVTLKKALANGGPIKQKWHVVRNMQSQVKARLNAAIPGKTWLEVDEAIRPECHRGDYSGFTNVYGRMSWQQTPVTITGGCTTASKGRFGHPLKSRTTISVREAALIQTFPRRYRFVTDRMESVCDMIGNAVPPHFAHLTAQHIREVIDNHNEQLAQDG